MRTGGNQRLRAADGDAGYPFYDHTSYVRLVNVALAVGTVTGSWREVRDIGGFAIFLLSPPS